MEAYLYIIVGIIFFLIGIVNLVRYTIDSNKIEGSSGRKLKTTWPHFVNFMAFITIGGLFIFIGVLVKGDSKKLEYVYNMLTKQDN